MEELRPNEQRAKYAVALIVIVLVLEFVSLVSGYMQYDLLKKVANGAELSVEKANANDLRERMVGIVYMIAYVVSAVTFIRWFRRAYYNLHLRVNGLSFSAGWAAGSWFVPILNLFRPFQIMKELYVKTKDILILNGMNLKNEFSTHLLGWWWALWIIDGVLGQFVFRFSRTAESVEELTTLTITSMTSNVIEIFLSLITIKVIKDYASQEPLLFNLRDEVEMIGQDILQDTPAEKSE